MTVTIELQPEIEARLANLAAEQGLSLAQYLSQYFTQYLCRLLEGQMPAQAALSPAERASAWRKSVTGLPHTPPLPDDAISRESIYDARG